MNTIELLNEMATPIENKINQIKGFSNAKRNLNPKGNNIKFLEQKYWGGKYIRHEVGNSYAGNVFFSFMYEGKKYGTFRIKKDWGDKKRKFDLVLIWKRNHWSVLRDYNAELYYKILEKLNGIRVEDIKKKIEQIRKNSSKLPKKPFKLS